METTTETESPEEYHEPDMVLSTQAQYDLQQAGKWAQFIAIMGFIGCGLILLVAMFAGTFLSYMSRFSPRPSPLTMVGPLIGIIYFIIAIIAFFINYNLYLFGARVKTGIAFISLRTSSALEPIIVRALTTEPASPPRLRVTVPPRAC